MKGAIKNNLFELMQKCINYVQSLNHKTVSYKRDGSIVTQADIFLSKFISNQLFNLYPKIPIISEEEQLDIKMLNEETFWLIDPIDGTASFAKGGKGYTINIALIEYGEPVIGIIGYPPDNKIWYGQGNKVFLRKNGAFLNLNLVATTSDKIRIVCSHHSDSETMKFLDKIENAVIKKYSSSIKFCKLAEGKADFYPRIQSIKKWDIAAGDAILRASGGIVLNSNGEIFDYSNGNYETGSFFAVSSMKLWEKLIKNNILN